MRDAVRTYVKNVLTKLGAPSRLQLAALASREELLVDQVMTADAFTRGYAGHPVSPQVAAEGA